MSQHDEDQPNQSNQLGEGQGQYQGQDESHSQLADYLMGLAFTNPQQLVAEVMSIFQQRLMYEAMRTMQTALLNQLMVIDQAISNTNKNKSKGENDNEF